MLQLEREEDQSLHGDRQCAVLVSSFTHLLNVTHEGPDVFIGRLL